MAETMRAARLHEPGKPMRIDAVPVPQIRAHEVLVQVKACGVIPNMLAVFSGRHWHHLPPLPAIVGLDAAGVVARVGAEVNGIAAGDRVYINPLLSCGSCFPCRHGEPSLCAWAAFRGYFAFSPQAVKILRENPYGGFAEFTAAAARTLVKLPDEVTFEQGARWGYLGTSYAALRLGGARAGSWIAINGVTGTLGVGAVIWSLAMGATRILGWGRNRELLAQVKALAPNRIDTMALGDRPIDGWVRERTEGQGADVLLDCTGRGSLAATTLEAIGGLKGGGTAVNISALAEPVPIDPLRLMNSRLLYRGSNWFSVAQGEEMAELARAGLARLDMLTPRSFPLDAVNDALEAVRERPGGFTNIVVAP